MVNNMAANEETVSIDTVKKTLWDSLEALGNNISGETLTALMKIIEDGESASNAPLETNCTISVDEDKQILSTDLTAAELLEAIEAGKFLALNITIEGAAIQKIIVVDVQSDDDLYDFSFTTVSTNEGIIGFIAAELSAEETVVFRQV